MEGTTELSPMGGTKPLLRADVHMALQGRGLPAAVQRKETVSEGRVSQVQGDPPGRPANVLFHPHPSGSSSCDMY